MKCHESFTFVEGTPPAGHPTSCPEQPTSRPTPTVTMTPRFEGVTRHGSLVQCFPDGDEREWVIRTPLRSMVCRDGVWVREPLKNPEPESSDTSKPRLHPPAGRWHTGVPGS